MHALELSSVSVLRVGFVEGTALYRVRRHRRDRGGVHLTRADPNDPRERLDEDLPVTDLAGAGRCDDRLDGRLHERLRNRHLEPYLLAEFEHDGRAAILLLEIALAAVAAHATDRDTRDASAEQRGLYVRQPLRADNSRDEFH